jgi:hypothetical protein
MSKEIDQAVADYLASIYMGFKAEYVGFRNDPKWQHDLWSVVFDNAGTFRPYDNALPKSAHVVERFEYKTGIGHRKLNKAGERYYSKLRYDITKIDREYVKMPEITAASVLYCLLLDGYANDQNFNDWCDNYGYDSDSISAFETYRACCESGKKLEKLFPRQQREHLRELLQDY